MKEGLERIAAVDLGSNSFHMVVARVREGVPEPEDRAREMVRLAEGLGPGDVLEAEVVERALECLGRFGQRLKGLPPEAVRVVGTNTLRAARNARAFRRRAEALLGHRIEIISGQEEGRLVFLGMAQTSPEEDGARLLVDIGGGSTEIILGEGFEAREVESHFLGCVGWSQRFFDKNKLSRKRFEKALLLARKEFHGTAARFRGRGFEHVIGSSGTVQAAEEVIRAMELGEGLSKKALRKLVEAVLLFERLDEVELPGLNPKRAPVFAGGLAILLAFFEEFGVSRMRVSAGALREGLLFDILGRDGEEDVRERTIRGFQRKFHVDEEQAERVERCAREIFDRAGTREKMDAPELAPFLSWAARVHECGLSVARRHHHRHGAYLCRHSYLPGFSRDEQELLAFLVGTHRRKLPREPGAELREDVQEDARRLMRILRAAVALQRGRGFDRLPELNARWEGDALRLELPKPWMLAHPLTAMDLEELG
ncbi:MAG TPA: Ppx/GppA family phosphatase [Planctomycetes bacterium]|nr:Ppx/GppA family phosphatase [Planctomycetota bacterium]